LRTSDRDCHPYNGYIHNYWHSDHHRDLSMDAYSDTEHSHTLTYDLHTYSASEPNAVSNDTCSAHTHPDANANNASIAVTNPNIIADGATA
jgi:hypothetical protein